MSRNFEADDFDPDIASARAAATGGDCDACRAAALPPAHTPLPFGNLSGQDALHYRIGTQEDFRSTMIDRLWDDSDNPLKRLISRSSDEFVVSLLDAGATLFDVVTFYQERIANENYLRTATERLSIEAMAELLNHVPRPGVAATTFLAFTVEPGKAPTIPKRTAAQSLPTKPSELPQTFETMEEIETASKLNRLGSVRARPNKRFQGEFSPGARLTLSGTGFNVQKNDVLLFGVDMTGLSIVKAIHEDVGASRTTLRIRPWRDPEPPEIASPIGRRAWLLAFQQTITQLVTDAETASSLATTEATIQATKLFAEKTRTILTAITKALSTPPSDAEFIDWLVDRSKDLTPSHDVDQKVQQSASGVIDQIWGLIAQASPKQFIKSYLDTEFVTPLKDAITRIVADPNVARTLTELFEIDVLRENLSPQLNSMSDASNMADIVNEQLKSLRLLLVHNFESPLPSDVEKWQDFAVPAFLQLADRAQRFDPTRYKLYSIVPRYLETQQAGIPIDSAIARRIRQILSSIRNTLIGTSTADLPTELYPLLSQLQVEQVNALEEQYARIRPWIDAIVDDLTDVLALVAKTFRAFKPDDLSTAKSREAIQTEISKVVNSLQNSGPDIEPEDPGPDMVAAIPDMLSQILASSGLTSPDSIVAALENVVVASSDLPNHIKIFREHARPFGVDLGRLYLSNGTEKDDEDINPNVQSEKLLTLDREYKEIIQGSLIVIDRAGTTTNGVDAQGPFIFRVDKVEVLTASAYGQSRPATQLTLDKKWTLDEKKLSDLRKITIYVQSETLPLGLEPYDADIAGLTIELDGIYPGLSSKRKLIVRGERTDIPDSGARVGELAVIQSAELVYTPRRPGDHPHTRVTLTKPLQHQYKRATVEIFGNVAEATHGETVADEVLGNPTGRSLSVNGVTEFALRQGPLTYVPDAQSRAGARPELVVRVDGVLWHQAEQLAGQSPNAQVYVVQNPIEGGARICFGDGHEGAQPSPEFHGIHVQYRHGLGLAGNVPVNAISLPVTQVLGIQAVTNPLAATGGADRDSLETTRIRAPLSVAALDRLVGLPDYAAHSLTFAGIEKAHAIKLPPAAGGFRPRVVVTVAAAGGEQLTMDSELIRQLRRSLETKGDRSVEVVVLPRQLISVGFEARVRIGSDLIWEQVRTRIETELLAQFGFSRRDLTQPLWLSEVGATLQRVSGVLGFAVDAFGEVAMSSVSMGSDSVNVNAIETAMNSLRGSTPKALVVVARSTKISPVNQQLQPAQLAILNPSLGGTLILKPWDAQRGTII
ncbi:putative baseplate assembly protein [Schlesneria paludicola]|uniref:putative baseplate assembly protein n=1 Tax=Schlesneria paludicola TaxID=360056 RepID=UPI00029B03D6|nr:putative baseplate assembly protein [Schlesneria paludicola]